VTCLRDLRAIQDAARAPSVEDMTTPVCTSAQQEFTAYVRDRGPVLLRAARSLTANPCDAEDLLQTALAKTYLAWDRIADRGALDGYVRRTLVNTRTSQWRKRRPDEFVCEDVPDSVAPAGPDPAEQQAQRDALWLAVSRLPARQRAMVVLRYYEDLTETQTARVLGVSVGTVKSAVSRALVKLRTDPELSGAVTDSSAAAAEGRDRTVARTGSDVPRGMRKQSPVPTLA
jgi:RNA polymerase sigma-70 factor (sigma-E family)